MMATKKQVMGLLVCIVWLVLFLPHTVSAAATPAKVTGMKSGASTKSSVNISWKGQEGVSGYQVYRSLVYDGKYKKVLDVDAQMTAFCNRNLASGQEYFYKVRAYTYTGGQAFYGKFSKILRTRTQMPIPKKAMVRTRANIRKHAGTNHAIVATADAKTVVTVLCAAKDKSGGDWSYVSCVVDGRKIRGYIYNNLLQENGNAVTTQIGKVIASRLNVRETAGNNGKIIATLKRGQKVMLLGQVKAADGSVWYLVQFKKKGRVIKGYVASQYIRLV